MSRALGIDLGSKRIGVAMSDGDRRVATPLTTIERRAERLDDHGAVAELVSEYAAGVVVVGLPLSLDGTEGPAARAVLEEVAEMRRSLGVPVETIDERFSTVTANARLRERGLRRHRASAVVDQAAATVLLQAWLDREGPR